MASVDITFMDDRRQLIVLSPGDKLHVKEGVLAIVRGRYPARDDHETAENYPMTNIRSFVEYE